MINYEFWVYQLLTNYSPAHAIPDNFQVIPLSFSTNLDRLNPNIPEWREDIGQMVTKILAKVGTNKL